MFVTTSLKQLLERSSPQHRQQVLREYFFYKNQYERVAVQARDVDVLQAFYEVVDENVKRVVDGINNSGDKTITCKKGCAACCYIRVDVSEVEARYVKEYADENGIEYDREALRQQAGITMEERTALKSKCVFLADDNTCKVYEARPLACRKYNVVTPALFCDATRKIKGEVGVAVSETAEIIVSIYAQLKMEQGCFSKILLSLDNGK